MCRIERKSERKSCEHKEEEEQEKRERKIEMGLKAMGGVGESRAEKLKNSMSRSRMKLWLIRATTSVLLWTCVVQLTALGDMWGPRVLKGWPSCFSQESSVHNAVSVPFVPPRILPPKSEHFCDICF